MSKQAIYKQRINIRFRDETYTKLKNMAAKQKITISEVVRAIINDQI